MLTWHGEGRRWGVSTPHAGLTHTHVSSHSAPRLPHKPRAGGDGQYPDKFFVIMVGYFRRRILQKKAVETKHNFRTDKCQN